MDQIELKFAIEALAIIKQAEMDLEDALANAGYLGLTLELRSPLVVLLAGEPYSVLATSPDTGEWEYRQAGERFETALG